FNGNFVVLTTQTLLSTLLVLVTAEFLPKSLFLINPNSLLSFFAIPVMVMYWVLYLPVYLIVTFSKFLIQRALKLPFSEDKPVFQLTDLNHFVSNTLHIENKEEDHEVDKKIFNNALEFKTVKVRECMIPRTEITAVALDDDIEDLKRAFVESGHSKILVYRQSIDDVVGYCHSLELFKKPKSIQDILTPIIIVPEAMLANELMIQFITDRKSLALVVDEFGGTSGLVSIEDIMEQIFGEIQDEHDDEDWVEQQLDERTFLLSARHEIDYLNDRYGWGLPEGDYETLGGFILSITEEIPQEGQVVDAPGFIITIESKLENRIETVRVELDGSAED
ncbi:MAG: HlyC/CorC family transporter, partial [Cytophagales bacterium]|nr:HlyC/CorC family transporter [Cytophagales bacterium]